MYSMHTSQVPGASESHCAHTLYKEKHGDGEPVTASAATAGTPAPQQCRPSRAHMHDDELEQEQPLLEWLQEALVAFPDTVADALWNGGSAVVEWVRTVFKKTTWSLSAPPPACLVFATSVSFPDVLCLGT